MLLGIFVQKLLLERLLSLRFDNLEIWFLLIFLRIYALKPSPHLTRFFDQLLFGLLLGVNILMILKCSIRFSFFSLFLVTTIGFLYCELIYSEEFLDIRTISDLEWIPIFFLPYVLKLPVLRCPLFPKALHHPG